MHIIYSMFCKKLKKYIIYCSKIVQNRSKLTFKGKMIQIWVNVKIKLSLKSIKCWKREKEEAGGGVLPQKLDRGVWPASQNPYPIYDQNLRFFLPWPNIWYPIYDLALKYLFQTCLKIIIFLVQTNVKGNVYLLLLGRLQDCRKRIIQE